LLQWLIALWSDQRQSGNLSRHRVGLGQWSDQLYVRWIANWASIVELDEDLAAWGFETTIMVPFVAESEGIRQAAATAEALLQRFPRAKLVVVQNERDGEFAHLHEASDAAAVYRESVEPLLDRATLLRMPAIEAGSWRPFEAAHCRLMDVPLMPVR